MRQFPPEPIRAALDAVALFGLELLMMSEKCPDCGANLALVGRVHRCTGLCSADSLPPASYASYALRSASASRQARYRERHGDTYRQRHADYCRQWRQRRKLAEAAG
jgi:hypothetical protein